MLLENKTAVVTGCNRGIGKKILEVFSANGATIFACVRNITEEFKTSLNEIKKKYNNNFKVITTRVAKYFDDEILKLNNLNIVTLDHKELEFLRLRDLLEKSLIRPIYLS